MHFSLSTITALVSESVDRDQLDMKQRMVICALGTKVRNLHSWKRHENPYSGCFWPNPAFMLHTASYLTSLAARTGSIVSSDPNILAILTSL